MRTGAPSAARTARREGAPAPATGVLKRGDYVLRLDAARAALANAHADLERLEHETAANEAALVSPATPQPARIDHLAALKHLHEERGKVRAATRDIAEDVDAAKDDLNASQRALAAHDGNRATRPAPARC